MILLLRRPIDLCGVQEELGKLYHNSLDFSKTKS